MARKKRITFQDRLTLPYGVYITDGDGSLYVYGRNYKPLYHLRRNDDGFAVTRANPELWVAKIILQGWFYSDGTAEARAEDMAALDRRLSAAVGTTCRRFEFPAIHF